jgi:4-hydroxymandelate oxidase
MQKNEGFPAELAEIQSMAQKLLKENTPARWENWTDVSGGAETGATWRRNLQAFEGLGFKLKSISSVDPEKVDLSVEIFGDKWDLPIAIAPMSSVISTVCKDVFGEMALGAKASGIAASVGYPAGPDAHVKMLEAGARVFRLIKPLKDLDKLIEALKGSQADGCFATGIDTDAIAGLKPSGDCGHLGEMVRPLSIQELKKARESVDIPFIIKGIVSEEDARAVLEVGADAIVVSTHAGYAMDYCLSSLEALPGIVRVVGKKMKVFLDSGIRRGSDIIKGLALGADAVLIGRMAIWGLVVGKGEGLSWILNLMADEMKRIMLLTSTEKLSDLHRDILIPLNSLGDRILSQA